MFNSVAERIEELEYRRVVLHGHFDHTRELLMWPRVQLNEGTSGRRNTEPGAFVITPFYCHETKYGLIIQSVITEEFVRSYILVNRGWVPKNRMDQQTRLSGQV